MLFRYRSSAVAVFAAVGLAACGGSPVGPSAVPAPLQSAAASEGVIVVGIFTLRGLPEGSFTLVPHGDTQGACQ
jgi:hypothetical protein